MSAIIFDFDGTIADTFDYVSGFMARKAGRPGLTLSRRQREFGGLSIHGMMDKLDKPLWWGLWMFFYGRRVMSQHMQTIALFEGMDVVLKRLHDQGHQLFILSSNRQQNVRLLLDHYQLTTYFAQIQGNASILRKSLALRWLLWRYRLEPEACFYVGDETGDLAAARRLKVRGVAVTWGYNYTEELAAAKPFALARTPGELLKLLQ